MKHCREPGMVQPLFVQPGDKSSLGCRGELPRKHLNPRASSLTLTQQSIPRSVEQSQNLAGFTGQRGIMSSAHSFLPLRRTPQQPLLFCSTFFAGALQKICLFSFQEQRGQQELVLTHSHQMRHLRLDKGEMWAFDLVTKAWAG